MTSRGRRAVSSLACAVVVAASAAGTLHARGLAESSSAVGAAPTQPPPTVLPVEPPPTLPPLRAPSFPAATPVWRDDFPDPAIFYEEGVYVAFGTEGDQDARLQVLLSWDLTQWVAVGDALVETPRWAEGTATWSPAPARADDGTVLLYYSARHRDLGVQCLSIARAAALDARFVDSSSGPLACDAHEGGAIDPSPFTDSDGRRYLLWKVDGASVGLSCSRRTGRGRRARSKPLR